MYLYSFTRIRVPSLNMQYQNPTVGCDYTRSIMRSYNTVPSFIGVENWNILAVVKFIQMIVFFATCISVLELIIINVTEPQLNGKTKFLIEKRLENHLCYQLNKGWWKSFLESIQIIALKPIGS